MSHSLSHSLSSQQDVDDVCFTASRQAIQSLNENVTAFWCDSNSPIVVLSEPPSSLEFLRNFVAPGRPCIIQNAIPSFSDDHTGVNNSNDINLLMTLDDLVDKFPDLILQVDVTPDGHGDCIRKVRRTNMDGDEIAVDDVFVQPQSQSMTMTEFRHRLRQQHEVAGSHGMNTVRDRVFDASHPEIASTEDNPPSNDNTGVVYYSRQNDCLRSELGPLANLVPNTIQFAQDAFGTGPPDAITCGWAMLVVFPVSTRTPTKISCMCSVAPRYFISVRRRMR
jgi:hypothetical protein